MTPPFFGGYPFDRLDHLRGNAEALDALACRANAGVLRLDGPDFVLDHDGRLVIDPLVAGEPLLLLGSVDGAPLFARIAPVPSAAARSRPIFALLERLDPRDAPLFAAARSVLDWHARHGFCAGCGQPTRVVRAGWGRRCDGCGSEHFPRVDPVAIMLAEHDASVLIGRQPGFPPGRYSALAGFIEPGESIEDAVARELREEAGVRVTSVRYLASQPWPFPSSLMIGCIATVADKRLTIDRTELEDAIWVTAPEARAALAGDPAARFVPPPPQAIARDLLDAWLASAA